MSLAIYAAPFNEINDTSNDIINKKKQNQNHNKTQKIIPKDNSSKVNSILEEIHNNSDEDDEKNQLGDYSSSYNFNPPPKPQSAGVSKTISTEQMQNMTNDNNINNLKTLGRAPNPNYEDKNNLDLNNFDSNYGDNKKNEEYYKNILPNYKINSSNKQYYNSNSSLDTSSSSSDIVLQKLNYMINLIEEQKDERTNNTTEEVILYCFLGIFIIFIVDSFSRVGKYIR